MEASRVEATELPKEMCETLLTHLREQVELILGSGVHSGTQVLQIVLPGNCLQIH